MIRIRIERAVRTPGAKSPVNKQVKQRVMEKQNHQCAFCGSCGSFDHPLDIHHIQRQVNNGKSEQWNLFALCYRCHRFLDAIYNKTLATRLILLVQVISPGVDTRIFWLPTAVPHVSAVTDR